MSRKKASEFRLHRLCSSRRNQIPDGASMAAKIVYTISQRIRASFQTLACFTRHDQQSHHKYEDNANVTSISTTYSDKVGQRHTHNSYIMSWKPHIINTLINANVYIYFFNFFYIWLIKKTSIYLPFLLFFFSS